MNLLLFSNIRSLLSPQISAFWNSERCLRKHLVQFSASTGAGTQRGSGVSGSFCLHIAPGACLALSAPPGTRSYSIGSDRDQGCAWREGPSTCSEGSPPLCRPVWCDGETLGKPPRVPAPIHWCEVTEAAGVHGTSWLSPQHGGQAG